jgi:hypothetical protein
MRLAMLWVPVLATSPLARDDGQGVMEMTDGLLL